jgi:hypothetical protein
LKIKTLYPLLALACLHLAAGIVVAQPKRVLAPTPPAVESNANSWQTFISPEGRFSIRLPGIPAKGGQVLNTAVGSTPSFTFTLKTTLAEYLVTYTDFPVSFDDPAVLKDAYDGGRDQTLSTRQLTLVSDRDVTIDRHVGRHISAVGKGQLFNSRVIAVGKRLYQVLIVTKDYRKYTPARIRLFESTINTFLESFKLIPTVVGRETRVSDTRIESGEVDFGRMEKSEYLNDYFGFRVSVPESWHLIERETRDAALQVSKEMSKGSDPKVNAGIDKSMAKTYVLFSLTKFPLRTPNVRQAMFQCGIEELSDKDMSARVYLEKNKDFLLNSPLNYKLLKDVFPATVAGTSFYAMDMQQSAGGVTVTHRYYSTVRKGYALFFVISYFDDADRLTSEKALQASKFELDKKP